MYNLGQSAARNLPPTDPTLPVQRRLCRLIQIAKDDSLGNRKSEPLEDFLSVTDPLNMRELKILLMETAEGPCMSRNMADKIRLRILRCLRRIIYSVHMNSRI